MSGNSLIGEKKQVTEKKKKIAASSIKIMKK
jgi:hypothetical protein